MVPTVRKVRTVQDCTRHILMLSLYFILFLHIASFERPTDRLPITRPSVMWKLGQHLTIATVRTVPVIDDSLQYASRLNKNGSDLRKETSPEYGSARALLTAKHFK